MLHEEPGVLHVSERRRGNRRATLASGALTSCEITDYGLATNICATPENGVFPNPASPPNRILGLSRSQLRRYLRTQVVGPPVTERTHEHHPYPLVDHRRVRRRALRPSAASRRGPYRPSADDR